MIEQGKGGAILMVSDILSSVASQSRSVYCCTKAALDQLTRCLALELGPYQIRVNSINLTVVLTPLTIGHGWDNPEKSSRITSKIPLGRLAGISCSSTFKLQMMQLLQTVKSSLTKCLLTDRSYPSENSMR